MSERQFARRLKFTEYQEKYRDFFIMERKGGIILLQMNFRGQPVEWNEYVHDALSQAWYDIGNDPENHVMILTSTGTQWIGRIDPKANFPFDYDSYYAGATKLLENLIFSVDIPTIAAVNGPGIHTEIALLCDITLCTEDAFFQDGHFMVGFVPGDGQMLTLQGLAGIKRAGYAAYTGKQIDAKTALEWGLVNEVLPREQLLWRAWQIAEQIMKQPRATRCLTHQLLTRPWKNCIASDLHMHVAHEGFADQCDHPSHNLKRVTDTWG